MHNTNTKKKLLCFCSSDFNNSFDELKEYLNFNLTFTQDLNLEILDENISILLIDNLVLKNDKTLKTLKMLKIPKLLFAETNFKDPRECSARMDLPLKFSDLNIILNEILTKKKFNDNSSINIKDYILDKNEKKLKKNNTFIVITEKEIQLLELLFKNDQSLTKKDILKTVWKYAEDADTHTVETHIYRLRKKILNKFKDENFIINDKKGYLI